MRYVYSAIRYVPNPASGEFVNVGAIAGSDEAGDWDIRQVDNTKRARAFGPSETLNASFELITELGRRIDDTDGMFGQDVSEDWLEKIQARYRNVVQLSPPAAVIAESAAEALEFVFDQIITETAIEGSRRDYITRRSLKAQLRNGYRGASIPSDFVRERICIAPSDDETRTSMDFFIGNGAALQLAHTWSFQVVGFQDVVREVKAWGYTLGRLREKGGRTDDATHSIIDRDVTVDVLVAPPRTREQIAVYTESKQVFRSLNVNVVEVDNVSEIAAEAQKELRKAGFHTATLT